MAYKDTEVEVVSPGDANRSRDYRHKRTEYAARGIAEYWIADPETRQVTICQWVDGQYEGTVFQGNNRIGSTSGHAFNCERGDYRELRAAYWPGTLPTRQGRGHWGAGWHFG